MRQFIGLVEQFVCEFGGSGRTSLDRCLVHHRHNHPSHIDVTMSESSWIRVHPVSSAILVRPVPLYTSVRFLGPRLAHAVKNCMFMYNILGKGGDEQRNERLHVFPNSVGNCTHRIRKNRLYYKKMLTKFCVLQNIEI